MILTKIQSEKCIPHPGYLIKSIAEQGYTLETSIADLIDNSITADANRVEVLVDTEAAPFLVFIADNGNGMTEDELRKNMEFPSNSPDTKRNKQDLGRFGLGLKTASFAQTRRFTVITRKKEATRFKARTWDVELMSQTGEWEIILNDQSEIDQLLERYLHLNRSFIGRFEDMIPNTIVVWQGLYKFENDEVGMQRAVFQEELNNTVCTYLKLIFHRFLAKKDGLMIRVNNQHLEAFDPFPEGVRRIDAKQKLLFRNNMKLEGFVLPNSSLQESKENSKWTLPGKSLADMEGIYIYRGDRLIVFGGWQGVHMKKSGLQLARLRVEIENGIDHLFHLNVAKSSISIPFSERMGFKRYIAHLVQEAKKEYYNFERTGKSTSQKGKKLMQSIPTSHGMRMEVDDDFPLIKEFKSSLNTTQQNQWRIILRMLTTQLNKIKQVHMDEVFAVATERMAVEEDALAEMINSLRQNGFSPKDIAAEIIPSLGIDPESLPPKFHALLK